MAQGFSNSRLLQVGGACLIASSAGVPIAMSPVSIRANDFAKLLTLVPLSMIGLSAIVWAVGWRGILGEEKHERRATMALLAFILLAAITTATADSQAIAFFGRLFRPEGMAAWIAIAAAFLGLRAWTRATGRGMEFADVMLLTSLVPAGYAIQQWLGYDFFLASGSDARAIGTFGSPGLLGSYLAVMLVATLARILSACREPLPRTLWAMLALLLFWALWLTRARGPLLAAFCGMAFLVAVFAIRKRYRGGLWASMGGMLLLALLVAAINFIEPARNWAQGIPALNRLIFALGRDASLETNLASRSILSRLGTWQAGENAFLDASWQHRLFGFGPESAQPAYFRHIPASVMRAEDFRTVANFDRLHADVLDMTLNFGLVGWLLHLFFFSSIVYIAASRIFGPHAAGSGLRFTMLLVVAGSLAALAVTVSGYGMAAPPAFGLAVALAWAIHLCLCAMRAGEHEMASQGLPADGVRIRLLGLIAGLIVFWIDAQINFTLLSGHLVAYSIAALLIGATMVENTSGKVIATVEVEKLDPWVFEFGIGMVLVATFASFLSPVGGEAGEEMLQVASRCVLPIIVFLAAGLLRGNMVESSDRHSVRWFMFTVGLPLAYLMAHLLMRPSLGEGFEIAYVDRIAETRLLIVIFLLLASMLLLVKVRAGNSASVRMRMGIVDLGIHAGILAILVVFVGMAWRALVGDVAAGSAQLVDVKDRHTIDELAEIAVSAAPWEWRHHSDLIYRRLGHALADLTPAGVSPERASDFRRELGKAETAAYMAVERFENEPWAVLSLAKVLQVRALSVIRPLYPESGAAAVAAADAAFEKAHWMFPAQPLTLHGWAQLKFDNGDVLEGYRLLDRMEAIIPGEPEPYVERIAAAIRVRDQSTMTQTLVRARSMLTMEQAESLARYSESLQKQ